MGQRRTAPAVELTLRWGDVVLRTASIQAPGRFVLGEGGDWELPAQALGGERVELLRLNGDEVLLSVPAQPVRALHRGSRAHVGLGALSVDIDVALAPLRIRRRGGLPARALVPYAFSLALHAGFISMLALFFVPRLGPDEADADERTERVAFLLQALDGSALREREHPVVSADDDDEPAPGQGGEGQRGGGTGARARGEEGSLGSSASSARGGRAAVQGPRDEPDAHLAREAALRDAATFGLATGLLAVPVAADPRAPSSPWGRATSRASDRASARAPLWGHTVEDAFGAAGLALSGTGEGGGGLAAALGLGDLGAFGRGAGTGTNASFGPGDGLGEGGEGGGRGEGMAIGGIGSMGMFGHGSHTIRQGRVIGDGCSVTGRLGADAIQRVVRANFGRFRLCYENGLRKNPTLQGRVTTRFLVARDGSVAYAADGGSDVPDASVVSCVVGAFSRLSFPEPAGGTVAVEYPIAFSPD
jgi:hypothetical protein